MSEPILPLPTWPEGIEQPDIVFNDLALRVEILEGFVISSSVSSQPVSPSDGDIYILGSSPTGAQWSDFDQFDLAIYRETDGGGNWYAFAPVLGPVLNLDGDLVTWNGSSYDSIGGGGGGGSRNNVNALTISSGVVNIDCSLGDFFTLSLTANVTSITFSNLPAAGKAAALAVRIQQDGAGGRTVALPSSFKEITGSDTSVQSGANAYTILHIETFDQGTRWEYSMKAGAA